MGKIAFLAGLGAGYVLGARAGEQRYEQLKAQADRAWNNPQVQNRVTTAQEQVKAKAPVLGQKAKEGAAGAAASAKDRVARRGDKDLPETIHRGDDGQLHADTTGFGPGGEQLP